MERALDFVIKSEILLGQTTVADAIHRGLPVILPVGTTAVRVVTDKGRVATVVNHDPRKLVEALQVLKGAGPYSSVAAGQVRFTKSGGWLPTSFEPVYRWIEVNGGGE
jgi:hypothetical protein